MDEKAKAKLRAKLQDRRAELDALLGRIRSNITRGLDRDSKERAKELEDSEVVDALGNDAVAERRLIAATLSRLEDDSYGVCQSCEDPIANERLAAYPYASLCVDCATDEEQQKKRA
ncbi:MAG: TraR/DksA family transcriptional regulator [Woeseia sp.]|nr:TraR/DksA family transcriptional regulator [Woeseia sp.]MBT8096707.1 TraR/DksA family transcriptional regulator [Woeseia sp.]NNE59325.1 TraR/DksA family transcriptional regulator [Woeseia sp.]NNL55032.1 TraR/DksA family transcriptional regulator [Woeseia sp.]